MAALERHAHSLGYYMHDRAGLTQLLGSNKRPSQYCGTIERRREEAKMSQRGVGRASGGHKKRMSVSYTIRDVKEPLNRAGVNALAVDHAKKLLYTAGRDAIIRCWDISETHGQKQCVSGRDCRTVKVYP